MSRKLGAVAEQRAAVFLSGLGYRVLERNFTCRMGELDIVAQDGDTVVFVEVRSRASLSYGLAAETIVMAKRRKLIKTASLYAQARGLDCPMRFDVVAFGPEGLEHFPDAFPAF